MFQLYDIRESRVYKEAREEGLNEGRGQEKREILLKLAVRKFSPDEIADILDLGVDQVIKEIEKIPS